MPMISLIVPVYNSGLCLEPCLASLAGQTHTPLEILLVDDGSTDGSETVCAAWAGRDERFRLLRFGGRSGPNAARAFGLAAARGEWIGFVDSDDLVHPRFAESLLEAAQRADAPMACCRYRPFMGQSPAFGQAPPPAPRPLDAPGHLQALLHDQRVDYSLCNKLYRRDLLEEEMFSAPVRYNEDLLTNWLAFARTGRLAFVEWEGYYYRQNPASASRRGAIAGLFSDQALVARRIRDEAKAELAESAWAFYYEKLLYLHSMILRQDAPEYFDRERLALEQEFRPLLGRALGCRALRPRMKLVGLLASCGGAAYRRLCRLALRDRQM